MEYNRIEVLADAGFTPLQPYNTVRDEWLLRWRGTKKTEVIEAVVQGKPTIGRIKEIVIAWHNEQIDEQILTGHRYDGAVVYLSAENQTNYKVTFDLAVQFGGQHATIPVTFKLGTDAEPVYKDFTTVEMLMDFYLSCVTYVKRVLSVGWARKERIDWSIYEEDKGNEKE